MFVYKKLEIVIKWIVQNKLYIKIENNTKISYLRYFDFMKLLYNELQLYKIFFVFGWWYSGEDASLLFRGLGFDHRCHRLIFVVVYPCT